MAFYIILSRGLASFFMVMNHPITAAERTIRYTHIVLPCVFYLFTAGRVRFYWRSCNIGEVSTVFKTPYISMHGKY